jgi:lipid II:glycine glycyltransferase (peptidoglycan interpeptide bridge formation enzyme)
MITRVTDGCQVRVSDKPDDPDWDAFLAKTPGGHYVQSSLWARMKALSGWRATRVVVTRGDDIVGGAQLLTRPLPLVGAAGYVPKGVLVASDDARLSHLVIDAVHQAAAAHRVQYLAMQPPGNGQAFVRELPAWGFRPNPRLGTVTATVRIDLSPEPGDILAQMKKKTRSNIHRGQSQGITAREGVESDLETFYRLLAAASRRKQFPIYSETYYAELWRVLGSRGHLKLFLAEYAGEAVSAMLAIPFGDTMFTHVSAWSGRHRERKPNEALEWAAMMWAKARGYRYYDFEGIDPKAARAVLRGEPVPDSLTQTADRTVTRYKLGFGGQVTLLPGAYEYVYNPFLRWAYHTALPKIQHWPMIAKVQKGLMRASQPRL